MWTAIAGIIQILAMILNAKITKDAEERKKKDELLTGWKDAVKSGDSSVITAFVDKLRK